MKIKVVALDITGTAKAWLDQNGDENHMELCEILTIDDDSPIPIADLPRYHNWDLLLVFEDGVRDQIVRLLDKLGIPDDKVLYPLDMMGSLFRNRYLAGYIFCGLTRDVLDYLGHREIDEKYSLVSFPGFSYMNVSSDNVILPYMSVHKENWASDDMKLFYDLSQEYFEFSDSQNLFCDIGANIGTTCIYFNKILDKDVRIMAFEPSPENYKLLRINAMINDLDPSEHYFVNKGLSDTCAGGQLNYDPENPGGSSLIVDRKGTTQDIELVTLDSYLKDNSINADRIKYMWIDVEGFEARFLAGARETLSQISVPIIMEFTPLFYAKRENEFELLINELKRNFKYFVLAEQPGLGKIPIERLEEEKDNGSIQWNLFLLKD